MKKRFVKLRLFLIKIFSWISIKCNDILFVMEKSLFITQEQINKRNKQLKVVSEEWRKRKVKYIFRDEPEKYVEEKDKKGYVLKGKPKKDKDLLHFSSKEDLFSYLHKENKI